MPAELELSGVRPDQAPQNREGQFVFRPESQQHLEFPINTDPVVPVVPDVEEQTRVVHDLYKQQVLDRQRVAAEQREAQANDEQRRYSVECDTIAMANIQDYAATHGLDPAHEQLTQDKFELAG